MAREHGGQKSSKARASWFGINHDYYQGPLLPFLVAKNTCFLKRCITQASCVGVEKHGCRRGLIVLSVLPSSNGCVRAAPQLAAAPSPSSRCGFLPTSDGLARYPQPSQQCGQRVTTHQRLTRTSDSINSIVRKGTVRR